MQIDFILFLVTVLGVAFFSGAETAMLGLNPLNVVMGDKLKLYRLYKNKEAIISTCLIGHSVCIVSATLFIDTILGTPTSSTEHFLFLLIDVLFFILLLIFGELLPKTLAKNFESITLQVLFLPIYFFYYLFWPISWLFLKFSNLLFHFFPEEDIIRREDIFYFLSYHLQGNNITSGLMSIGSTQAKEIMTPLSQIYSLDKYSTVKDFMNLMAKTSYSRYPIFEDRGDNIIGYVQVTDLINAQMRQQLSRYICKAIYIPEHLPADKLLSHMQSRNTPMVFVINEFGNVIGLITIENLAEEVVGSIDHQLQPAQQEILWKEKNQYILLGSLDIDDFNEYFKKRIDKIGFETLAGYLMRQVDRIPSVNEDISTTIGNFKVLQANDKQIYEVLFTKGS